MLKPVVSHDKKGQVEYNLSLPKENNDAIYDAVGIMWHWFQWHYVTSILIILT